MIKRLVFFILEICFGATIFFSTWQRFFICQNFVDAAYQNENHYIIVCGDKKFDIDLSTKKYFSRTQKIVCGKNKFEKFEIAQKILKMGFSIQEAINYIFPTFGTQIDKIAEKVDIPPTDAKVVSGKNCKIVFINEKYGSKIAKNELYFDFLENFCKKDEFCVNMVEDKPNVFIGQIVPKFVKSGEFSTSFESSGDQRRNNIKIACDAIDGKIIAPGEVLSFNACTGDRNLEGGYQSAKIIVGGKYVDGIGGGVCQVSTTLYNAALLSGLDIVEVHNHTLPVGYVMPCFDAMVNMGSSDLKIKNNSENSYIVTAQAENGKCRVVIYGVPPKYQIVQRFDKYQTIPFGEEEVIYDENFNASLDVVQNVISWPSEGYCAKGYLDYYQDGVLVKTKQICDNRYEPKRKIVSISN